jgi:hypothetical protein
VDKGKQEYVVSDVIIAKEKAEKDLVIALDE